MPDPEDWTQRRRERRARERRLLRRQRRGVLALFAVMLIALLAAGLVNGFGSSGGDDGGADKSGSPPPPSTSDGSDQNAAGPPARPSSNATVRVTAVGDTVMGSPPYGLPPDGGRSFFSQVKPLLAGQVVLGNLEGTLSTGGYSKCGAGSSNCYAFRTPPSYARWLVEAGFTVMNLANNHSFDFGAQGQRETVAALKRARLLETGRPGTVAYQSIPGHRVAIVGFAPYKWANSLLDIPAAKRRVAAAARQADIVIVTFHGGAEGSDRTHVRPGMESYLGEQRGDLIPFSHAVIDAGADLVIGHGPHVVRGMEVYRGRLIAYSLGNFAGYEVFSLGGALSTSMVLQVTLGPDGKLRSGRIRPTQLVGSGTPAPGGNAVSLVRQLSGEDFGSRAPRIASDGTIRPR